MPWNTIGQYALDGQYSFAVVGFGIKQSAGAKFVEEEWVVSD